MKLKLLDRIVLLQILPSEGNMKTLTINRDLKKKLELKQKEYTDYNIQIDESGRVAWNEKGIKASFEYNFSALEENEIKLALQQKDRDKKMTQDMLGLCELFKVVGE